MSSLLPAVIVPAFIPSPSQGVWHVFGLPLRAYALCILAGIFAGYWLGRKRWVARGGSPEVLGDIIMWAVPFGLVGARIYHVLTDWKRYFGEGADPVDALKIWNGGLGIWGAIAFGALGAWLACRRHKVPFLAVADAMAPGIALAQVLGRFGNYWNQELYGRPTDQWFGLEIDPAHRVAGFEQFATFHPTFLYEMLWNLGVVALVVLADRRFRLGHGRAFALYVAGYTAGRAWIENLRIDTADEVLGLRLNVWTALIVFAAAVVFFVLSARTRPGRENITTTPAPSDDTDDAAASTDEAAASTSAGGANASTSAGGANASTSAGGGSDSTSAGGANASTSADGANASTSAGGAAASTSAGGAVASASAEDEPVRDRPSSVTAEQQPSSSDTAAAEPSARPAEIPAGTAGAHPSTAEDHAPATESATASRSDTEPTPSDKPKADATTTPPTTGTRD
ncbi:prolipoprotein diacylglyceryl transferase [Kribbella flavida DSM 17836]|uniref:Phosphatidylglycerol--prolipoprotein diacylglyceryl transferase n=1 Tax=Kribbella flavida (strain DSM 17836 / JCM 10339 / NBRC 14399) TaxID=479435 RepID=D2Q309_KRIFD|nr:prolipoprotein diacylglyceryl transferase [Kribbella flavida]ADB32134.1 prolipoprotein diacylglyceryl transferase [Kribbella flavida DSM 17836]